MPGRKDTGKTNETRAGIDRKSGSLRRVGQGSHGKRQTGFPRRPLSQTGLIQGKTGGSSENPVISSPGTKPSGSRRPFAAAVLAVLNQAAKGAEISSTCLTLPR